MGACLNCNDGESKALIRVGVAKSNIPELNYDQVVRFLTKAKDDSIIGVRFQTIKPSRMLEIARRICTLLNYAFKHDTIRPFKDILYSHTMMKLTKEEVDRFFKLFIEEFYSVTMNPVSVQGRVLQRIKVSLLRGSVGNASPDDYVRFFQLARDNAILKDRFVCITPNMMNHITVQLSDILNSTATGRDEKLLEVAALHKRLRITAIEYDEFTSLFFKVFQKDNYFVTHATPIFGKLRNSMVLKNKNELMKMKLYDSMKMNPILSKRFNNVPAEKIKVITVMIVAFLRNPAFVLDIGGLVESHKRLMITEDEFDEFENVFCEMFPEKGESMKAMLSKIKHGIREKDIK